MAIIKKQPNYRLNGINPLAYMGVDSYTPPDLTTQSRTPTPNDYNWNIGTIWTTRNPSPLTIWMLVDYATWVPLYPNGGGTIQFVENVGTANPSGGILNVLGTSVLQTSGSGNTVDINMTNGSNGQLIIGGGSNPVWASVTAGAGITLTAGANSLTIASAGGGTSTFVTNSGTATQSGGSINVLGANVITTIGSGDTVTIEATNGTNGQVIIGGGANPAWASIIAGAGITLTTGANSLTIASSGGATTFVTDSGTATQSGGILNILGANVITTTGSGSTVTVEATNGSNGQVIIGGGANPLWASITAGSGITITPGANSLTIATTGGGGSGLVFLATQTVSSVSSVAFTSQITGTYNNYLVNYYSITGGGSTHLLLQFSSNGGSSYISSGYLGLSITQGCDLGAVAGSSVTGGSGTIFNVTSGAGYASWSGQYQLITPPTSSGAAQIGSACGTLSTVFNAIQFVLLSGGTFSGTIDLYGYSN